MFTEACTGANPWDLQKVLLGSWERGQEYINDIITNLNHWSTGWVDWNLGEFLSNYQRSREQHYSNLSSGYEWRSQLGLQLRGLPHHRQ